MRPWTTVIPMLVAVALVVGFVFDILDLYTGGQRDERDSDETAGRG